MVKKGITDDEYSDAETEAEAKVIVTTSSRGRNLKRPLYYELEDGDGDEDGDENASDSDQPVTKKRHSLRRGTETKRATRSTGYGDETDDSFEPGAESPEPDAELSLSDDDITASDSSDAIGPPSKRNLRKKKKINYTLPSVDAPPEAFSVFRSSAPSGGPGRRKRPNVTLPKFSSSVNFGLSAEQLGALYPDRNGRVDSSDSDSDAPPAPIWAKGGTGIGTGGGGMPPLPSMPLAPRIGGSVPAGSAGNTHANTFQKLSPAALTDTDPLGSKHQVSFDSVGGLDGHIQKLKEMVTLPLLYPDLFEKFGIAPPRGVLFYGPPGTGKTLVARALAASAVEPSGGRSVAFYMPKTSDILAKYVGESESRIRSLFETARANAPAIIFFDELDGLAPVRSSKQEQIHASIVSTLLALMDGIDSRGQVIVIGATNRPDAIDPALRRPGRFDRELFFPLPDRAGRRRILEIHARTFKMSAPLVDELARLTKGYGGADLKALCAEAFFNAFQRTYPQAYAETVRLEVDFGEIKPGLHDFMVARKRHVPAAARTSVSVAAPLPTHLIPLLEEPYNEALKVLHTFLPQTQPIDTLAEARFVPEENSHEKDRISIEFEAQRVYRPRVVVCGSSGMGQAQVAAALLHSLEGVFVQALDVPALIADAGRGPEAAAVQLFAEARRHRPAVLFVPDLGRWAEAISGTVRATIGGLIAGLAPGEPVLLLAVVDGPFSELPPDIRSWFGAAPRRSCVTLGAPSMEKRQSFFEGVREALQRVPRDYPGVVPRARRVLPKLAIAAPLPERVPTAEEVEKLTKEDERQLEYLKFRLSPVIVDLKKKFRSLTRSFYDDWFEDDFNYRLQQQHQSETITGLGSQPYHNVDLDTVHRDLFNNAYHSVSEFLADMERILFNAKVNYLLEGNDKNDIRNIASQMLNYVNVLLDQAIDEPFARACDEAAARMKTREAEKLRPQRKRQKGQGKPVDIRDEAVYAAACQGGYSPNSTGPSVEVGASGIHEANGQGPNKETPDTGVAGDSDAPLTNGERSIGKILLNGKRTNSTDNDKNVVEETTSDSEDKVEPEDRIIPDVEEKSLKDSSEVEVASEQLSSKDSKTETGPDESVALTEASQKTTIVHNKLQGEDAEESSTESNTKMDVDVASPGAEEPGKNSDTPASLIEEPVPYEDKEFIVPEDALNDLMEELCGESDTLFSVDQLEEIRALCYTAIWERRAEWDRTQLIFDIIASVREFKAELAGKDDSDESGDE